MNFMNCATCGGLVQVNATGTCLGCQRGFVGIPQEDAWINSKEGKRCVLENRKKEVEDALQKRETKEIPVCQQTKGCKSVRKTHFQREKTPNKSEEKTR